MYETQPLFKHFVDFGGIWTRIVRAEGMHADN